MVLGRNFEAQGLVGRGRRFVLEMRVHRILWELKLVWKRWSEKYLWGKVKRRKREIQLVHEGLGVSSLKFWLFF